VSVSPPQVVLFPDLIVHALSNHEPSRGILEQWRDGKIRAVSTRGLLERYLKALAGLGLNDVGLRRWIWWFTSPQHSIYLQRSGSDASAGGVCLCSVLAEETQSEVIYATPRASEWPPPPTTTKAVWTTAEDFLKR
jgi:hypothetical protein